jgi:hypothetical protein
LGCAPFTNGSETFLLVFGLTAHGRCSGACSLVGFEHLFNRLAVGLGGSATLFGFGRLGRHEFTQTGLEDGFAIFTADIIGFGILLESSVRQNETGRRCVFAYIGSHAVLRQACPFGQLWYN